MNGISIRGIFEATPNVLLYLILKLRYRMSFVDAQLLSQGIFDARDSEATFKNIFPKWSQRISFKFATNRIENHILKELLTIDVNRIERRYPSKVMNFIAQMNLLYTTLKSANISRSDLAGFAQSNRESRMRRIDNSTWMPNTLRNDILRIVEVLQDYNKTILSILTARPDELEGALKKIDGADFLNAVYGTSLASVCIMRLLADQNEIERISKFVEIGMKHAEKLEGYSDSLDVLTDPEEREMMKRAKEWEDKQLHDSGQ